MNHKQRILAFLYFLPAFFGLSLFLGGQSQIAEINWGGEYTEPVGTYLSKTISSEGSSLYALRQKKGGSMLGNHNKIYVEHYSTSNMKLIKSKEIDLRYKKKERIFEDVITLGGQLYLLTSFHNEAKKKNYLFAQNIDKKSLTLNKSLQKIGEIETLNVMKEGSFDLHISRDSSKILIMNQLPYKKADPERFALQVFDNNFVEIWKRDITLPYDDQSFEIEDSRVDGKGNVYLLGILYFDGLKTRKRGKPNYQYVMLSYPADGSPSQEYKVNIGDKFITDLTFRISNSGQLVCAGFYSDEGTYSIKGTYYFNMDPVTKELQNQNFKAFDLNFLVDDYSLNKQRKIQQANAEGKLRREPELERYALNDLILRSDGGVVLVAEQFFIQERTNRDYYSNNYTTDYYYNYNDIIVVNIQPTGAIEWAARIPKRQVTTNDGGYYSSFAFSIVRDKIYFVFNDNGRNFTDQLRNGRLYNFNGSNSIIALAELSIDGSVKIEPLFSNREADVITRPKVCRQIDKSEMVIYGEKGRRFRFAHLKFGKTSKL